MNSLGEDITGGTQTIDNIDGDLSISGSLDVLGVTTLDTFTANTGTIDSLQVGTLISDIVIEDPIIQIGKNNPSDNINMGIVSEYNDGAIKYSGIIRSFSNKSVYVLENVPSLINSTQDITVLPRGNFVVNDFIANDIVVRDAYLNGVVRVGSTSGLYTLPLIAGTIGQVLISNGNNTTTFQTSPINTLQTIYEDSTSPQIVTNASNPTFQIKEKNSPSLGQLTFDIRNAIDTESYFRVNNIGVGIGDVSNGYDLPLIKGSSNQVLKMATTGDIQFLDMFDQELNKDSNIIFKSVTLKSLSQGTISLDPEGFSQIEKFCHLGAKGNVTSNFKSRGSVTTPLSINLNDNICSETSKGYDGGTYQNSHSVTVKADENYTPSASGSRYEINTVDIGTVSISRKLMIKTNGVTIGDDLTGYTIPYDRGLEGQVLIQTSNNNVSWGYPTKSYGGMSFFGNTTKTDIPSEDVYYNITGTKNSNNLSDFTFSGDQLTYTGIRPKAFLVKADVSVWLEEGKEPETIGFAIFVDESIQNYTRIRSVLFEDDDWPQATKSGGIVQLTTGLKISCRISNTTNDNDIEVLDYTLTVTEI